MEDGMINFAKLKLKLCSPDEKQLRIKMNKIVEDNFETDSLTEMYHKLFVVMAVHGHNSRTKIISELLDVIEMQNEALDYYVKNAEPVFYEYVGEFPAGGYQQQLGEWTHANKSLSETESKLKQLIKGE
jgi:hypothetical protein